MLIVNSFLCISYNQTYTKEDNRNTKVKYLFTGLKPSGERIETKKSILIQRL